jgi:hypothetical protein
LSFPLQVLVARYGTDRITLKEGVNGGSKHDFAAEDSSGQRPVLAAVIDRISYRAAISIEANVLRLIAGIARRSPQWNLHLRILQNHRRQEPRLVRKPQEHLEANPKKTSRSRTPVVRAS